MTRELVRLRVSPRLAESYAARDVFHALHDPGRHVMSHAEARQVAQDARHCADPVHGPPDLPRALRTAYAALLGQLAEHERSCDCPGRPLTAAAVIGSKGGQARAVNMSPEARRAQSVRASAVRWKGHVKQAPKAPKGGAK